jgi:hypothetical protein
MARRTRKIGSGIEQRDARGRKFDVGRGMSSYIPRTLVTKPRYKGTPARRDWPAGVRLFGLRVTLFVIVHLNL